MKKIVISKAGRIGIIDGPNAHNQRLTWTTPDGFDPTVEEFEISCDPKEMRRLKKLNIIKEYRKYHVRTIYKRGRNKRLDRMRDSIDLAEDVG